MRKRKPSTVTLPWALNAFEFDDETHDVTMNITLASESGQFELDGFQVTGIDPSGVHDLRIAIAAENYIEMQAASNGCEWQSICEAAARHCDD